MPERRDSKVMTTVETTLVPDSAETYRRLRRSAGEQHIVRTDLVPAMPDEDPADEEVRLAGLVHFTDFQIADLASPSRVEFLQRREGQPEWARMLPAYRPQEFLLAHAIEMTVRSINGLVSGDPGRWDIALTTGDNTDSAQSNELDAFLSYLAGGTIEPAAGTRGFSDAPVGLGDENYYNPEPSSHDQWKRTKGLPTHAGALAASAEPFDGEGLSLPWLSCFGNHDCLVQGRSAEPSGYDEFLTGQAKPVGVAENAAPPGDKLSAYVEDPTWISQGASHPIERDSERRMVSKAEYVDRHLCAAGSPQGHGFTEDNRSTGRAYYVYDELPGVRMIVLDTTNIAGHVDGCVDQRQFEWLEERLVEVHTSYHSESGEMVKGRGGDRLVVIASHHGLSTMTNDYGADSETGEDRRGKLYLADEVERLLHRFDNVALWLSGHTHVNSITPRPGISGGFWEVSTGSIAEWPVQFRGIEISAGASAVRLRATMVDSQAPATPDGTLSLEDLASLHREIAANDDGSVGGLYAEGTVADRNQDLLVSVSSELLTNLRSFGAER
ncbi:TIGR03767 family metallophosphoesterase [Brevibacterium oceani]|uniref:TIGR03767 family metallophosphoesterase n=1 Tax=Brevibacterium oceani TaxID=358099 RepID=UPI001B3343BF|nr:TIGR03767 family metallophosphoesterase [Brevibacterium oceani]